MNKKIKILIGILIVGVLLIGGWWILKNQISGVCSDKTPQFCDKTCKSDDDCKLECCGCISKKEKCKCGFLVEFAPPHPCFGCKCIHNTCTLKGDKFYIDAEKSKNAFLCENIKNQNCKDICYFELALETKDISLCEKIMNVGNKNTCFEQLGLSDQKLLNYAKSPFDKEKNDG